MKTRKGFVSNSSSSSFIVSAPNNVVHPSKVQITVNVDLENYADNVVNSQKELDDYFQSEWGSFSKMSEHCLSLYRKASEEIKNNRKVIFGRFSSEGDEEEQYLCNNGLNLPEDCAVKVLFSEAGY